MVPVGLGIAWAGITGLDKLGEIMDAAAGRLGMPGWGFRALLGLVGSSIYVAAVALRARVISRKDGA